MRVQVNISEEMLRDIDSYSRKMGISRSAFCSFLIGQGVMNLNVAYEALENMPSELLRSSLDKEGKNDEDK